MKPNLSDHLPVWLSVLCLSIAIPKAPSEDTVTLGGRIVDAENDQSIPARLYIESADHEHFLAQSSGGIAIPYQKKRENSIEIHTSLSADPFTA